jgi:hypothetical protein
LLAVTWAPVWQRNLQAGRYKLLLGATLIVGLAVSLAGVLADHNRGFRLTMARNRAEAFYAAVPMGRVWSQLELLSQRPPDLWWIAGFLQTSGIERLAVPFVLAAILALLALSLVRLRRSLSGSITTTRGPSTRGIRPPSRARG